MLRSYQYKQQFVKTYIKRPPYSLKYFCFFAQQSVFYDFASQGPHFIYFNLHVHVICASD